MEDIIEQLKHLSFYAVKKQKQLKDYSNRCIAKCLHILADLSWLSFDKSSSNATGCITQLHVIITEAGRAH